MINGLLEKWEPKELMEKVKNSGYSMHTVQLGKDNKEYIISIHYEEWISSKGSEDPNTKYYFDIVSEDIDGHQERLTTYDESANLLDYQVVEKLNHFKEVNC